MPRAVTNTGDRGYGRFLVSHEVRNRRPALRQDDVVRFDNRDLVVHGGHPRQVRPVFRGFRGPFFFSTTCIAFITQRPLWFAFASHASCKLTRCLMRATQQQKTLGSADCVSRCATCSAPSGPGGKREIQHPALHGMRGINGARTCLSTVASSSTTHLPSVAAGSPHGPWPAPSATRPGATC